MALNDHGIKSRKIRAELTTIELLKGRTGKVLRDRGFPKCNTDSSATERGSEDVNI